MIALCLLHGLACRHKPAPVEDAALRDALEVSVASELPVEYVDTSGHFRVVDRPALVPTSRRAVLRVIQESTPAGPVQVIDLQSQERAWTRVMSRDQFEISALANLPPAEGSRLNLAGGSDPRHIPKRSDRAILYETAWCGGCSRARQHLEELGMPYHALDVEQDTQAWQGLLAIAESMGVVVDRVPVLLLRGRLLIGFDPERYSSLLGAPL